MLSSLLIIGFVLNFFSPLPPGIAINPETKECGEFYGGDEFGGPELPSPWEVIYDPTIQTDSGVVHWEGSVDEYCQQIGYNYVPGNLGVLYGQERKSSIFYIFLFGKFAPLLLIIAVILFFYSIYSKKMKEDKSSIDS